MKTAMILAAGRGERLKPLSNHLPKALCQVKGKTLIEYHLMALAQAGFEKIVINHAHLGGKIRRYLGKNIFGMELCYSPEPPGALETGGAIQQALPLLGENPFVTVNADIFTDYPFENIQLPKGSLAHLILVKNPSHNLKGDFSLDKEQQLSLSNPCFTFLGIAAYQPEAFRTCTPGRYPLLPLFRSLIEQRLASGELYTGIWIDIGTAQRLQEAHY